MTLPNFTPMPLSRMAEPFDDPDCTVELKLDGLRALAYIAEDEYRLVSRNGCVFVDFAELAEWVAVQLPIGTEAVLDGEIVCLDGEGRSVFSDLLFRREPPRFFAFDVLWLNGCDLRELPLRERKDRLRKLIDSGPLAGRLFYVQDFPGDRGVDVFGLACDLDLEGIVAKRLDGPYVAESGQTTWVTIKNPGYSQAQGRQELVASLRGHVKGK